ncbi:ATP-dependent DNA helicase [Schaalia sp. JY-X169]|uniref:ATP-dependent helicase n=1 Tax=Schaalia sp. JY-X169 TaxID=2758572 RepID=UPI0015F562C4|nr:ATP-dependent DNA helicase [Schaalia sp. JY-X169]
MTEAFDFAGANTSQREAISTTEGGLLIIAGPGTGKTFTLVNRVVYLLEQLAVEASQIFVATFTDKAAKELVTRISNELDRRGIRANVNEMYVGTFHSLALRIIKENLEFTRLKTGFRVLDSFDQSYTVFQNYHHFEAIENIEMILPGKSKWRNSSTITKWVNALSEELITASELSDDLDVETKVLGEIYEVYLRVIDEQNLLDFAGIQVEALRILRENDAVRKRYTDQLRYIMIDEYQDTNYIQEQLVFLLGEKHKNICVVGDDDQGLYRFRGATIRNILEFSDRFEGSECKTLQLTENYRSTPGIVDFYNNWMETTSGSKFKFEWDEYRYRKTIVAAGEPGPNCPTVVKVAGKEDADEWHKEILASIRAIESSESFTDLNQIAFLFRSVKHPSVTKLAEFLESNGINVYSPRSGQFFDRYEVKLAFGCLMLTLPNYVIALENDEFHWLPDDYHRFILSCVVTANEYLVESNNFDLLKWIQRTGRSHAGITEPTDYAFSGILYHLFSFEPFLTMLSTSMDSGVVDIRPSRNLALLTQLVAKFEYLHHVTLLSPKLFQGKRQIDSQTERLFNLYLRLLYQGGIAEYEDDSEYAPSGCVSFLTVHQSKGMEFPIVFVGSLNAVPRKQEDALLTMVLERHQKRAEFEPRDQVKFFDFWRLYYTAFSRAQNLLVLTANEEKSTPSQYFRDVYTPLPTWRDGGFNLSLFDFETVKDVNLKQAFSFTGDITVYETCSLQYKFFKDLEFAPVRVNAMLFGRLVHQTIEDIHRAALRGETSLITPDNIDAWFKMNYENLSKAERIYLAEPQQQAALEQVQRYVLRQRGDWSRIKEAEVDVSLVKADYILDGTIDLIRADDGSVEIIDFKATKKPDMVSDHEMIERYRRQLHVYAHLVEERTGERVSKMHLYYTGEESGNPMISWPYSKTAIEATVTVFDEVVHKILNKNYQQRAESLKTCKECDFNAYCAKKTNEKEAAR